MAANSEKTGVAKKGGTGRPFVKGQSGNPSGRPKKDPEVKAILAAASPAAATRLVQLCLSKVPQVALAACKEILDRTQGKPETVSKIRMDGGLVLTDGTRREVLVAAKRLALEATVDDGEPGG